jgi:hypothetical protein
MHQRNGKFVIALSLLLILSQWLSLAHASGHLVNSGDTYCQVCTLQHQFHSTTVNALPCTTAVAQKTYTYSAETYLYTTTPDSTRTIRAPPQYPHS